MVAVWGEKRGGRAAGEAKAAEGRLLGPLRREQAFLLGYSAGVRRVACRTTRLKLTGCCYGGRLCT